MVATGQTKPPIVSPRLRSPDQERFLADLAKFGPKAQYEPPSLRASRRYCRQLARRHYENFTVVSVFVPRELRQHFCNIYSWCRWADDLADETRDPQWGLDLLEWWQRELLACYQGSVRHPVLVALRETINRFNIPHDPFLDLLTAFRQDQRVLRYETFEELLDYCRHSANPVGRFILFLGRCHTPERVMLSDQICTGLQLVNFWQDVAQDYERGRIYIPKAECRRVGYSDEMFARHEFNPAFCTLMKGLVNEAAAFLRRGRPLVAMMPGKLRVPVYLFVRGGLSIARAIEKVEYNVWLHRPTLSRRQKVGLAIRTVWDVLCHRYDRE